MRILQPELALDTLLTDFQQKLSEGGAPFSESIIKTWIPLVDATLIDDHYHYMLSRDHLDSVYMALGMLQLGGKREEEKSQMGTRQN